MKRHLQSCYALITFLLLSASGCQGIALARTPMHRFEVRQDQFFLDGKPFQVISGEMHYVRTPHEYWRSRLKAAKAMGLNTITTYVFWNRHESKPGVYDFTGDNDIAEFLREAQEEGLFVILRPGPYVCAEWEFGGFPAWLLKDHSLVLRSNDPKFIAATDRWFKVLGNKLAPFQIDRGGPIIAVQVENEYGSFGNDQHYLASIRKSIVESGFTDSLLYTADGGDDLQNGAIPDLPAVVNFGAGKAQQSFAQLQNARPGGPMMAGEYWVGWFDTWGKPHNTSSVQQTKSDLEWMLSMGHSVSLYMFHGGTSFGGMNGANSNGTDYHPYVTSYDYDSPLDESGRSTPKFEAFREVISKATGKTPPAFPEIAAPISIPAFSAKEAVSLWDFLPKPTESFDPVPMEDLDQAYGWILYRTELHNAGNGELVLAGLNDYAQIYLDGHLAGTLDRRLKQTQMHLDVKSSRARLDILVQNSGRINYTAAFRGERKGINGQVHFAGRAVHDWEIFPLPMDDVENYPYSTAPCSGPCFYRASFDLHAVADSFLDTTALGKGLLWLNGHALGRFWKIGPQGTLYVPAPWLKIGKNTVHYFDVNGVPGAKLRGLEKPNLGATKK